MNKFKLLTLLILLLLTSCTLTTKNEGRIVVNDTYTFAEEYEGDDRIPVDQEWISKDNSTITLLDDFTISINLTFKSGNTINETGEYFLYVGEYGESGDGYLILGEEKLNLTFMSKYWIAMKIWPKWDDKNPDTFRIARFSRVEK